MACTMWSGHAKLRYLQRRGQPSIMHQCVSGLPTEDHYYTSNKHFHSDCPCHSQLTIKTLSRPVLGFPGGAVVEHLPANAGDARDLGSIPGLGRSPSVGNGNPLQYSYLKNSMDRGAWRVTQSMGSQRGGHN